MHRAHLMGAGLNDFQPLLDAGGRPLWQGAARLREFIERTAALGHACARCLALPRISSEQDQADWYVPFASASADGSYRIRAWAEASRAEQDAALAQLQKLERQLGLCSQWLRCHDDDPQCAEFARLLCCPQHEDCLAVLHCPGPECVFIVDGQPVLAFWGFVRPGGQPGTLPLEALGATLQESAPPPEPAAPLPPVRRPVNPLRWLLLAVAVLVAVVAGLLYWMTLQARQLQEVEAAPKQPGPQKSVRYQRPALPGEAYHESLTFHSAGSYEKQRRLLNQSASLGPPLPQEEAGDAARGATPARGEQAPAPEPISAPDAAPAAGETAAGRDASPGPREAEAARPPAAAGAAAPSAAAFVPQPPQLPRSEAAASPGTAGAIRMAQPEAIPGPASSAVALGAQPEADAARSDGTAVAAAADAGTDAGTDAGRAPPAARTQAAPASAAAAGVPGQAVAAGGPAAEGRALSVPPPSGGTAAAGSGTAGEAAAAVSAPLPGSAAGSAVGGDGGMAAAAAAGPAGGDDGAHQAALSSAAVSAGQSEALNGIWQSRSGLMDTHTGQPLSMSYAFHDGQGIVTVTRAHGVRCSARTAAHFTAGTLRIAAPDPARCPDGRTLTLPEITCTPEGSGRARCRGRYAGGEEFPIILYASP